MKEAIKKKLKDNLMKRLSAGEGHIDNLLLKIQSNKNSSPKSRLLTSQTQTENERRDSSASKMSNINPSRSSKKSVESSNS